MARKWVAVVEVVEVVEVVAEDWAGARRGAQIGVWCSEFWYGPAGQGNDRVGACRGCGVRGWARPGG